MIKHFLFSALLVFFSVFVNTRCCYSQTDTSLANKIIALAKADQDFMMSPPKETPFGSEEYFKKLAEIIEQNYIESVKIVDTYGFPGYDLVGKDAYIVGFNPRICLLRWICLSRIDPTLYS